jgi:hypothetical protein
MVSIGAVQVLALQEKDVDKLALCVLVSGWVMTMALRLTWAWVPPRKTTIYLPRPVQLDRWLLVRNLELMTSKCHKKI